jgi:hypothetical protein
VWPRIPRIVGNRREILPSTWNLKPPRHLSGCGCQASCRQYLALGLRSASGWIGALAAWSLPRRAPSPALGQLEIAAPDKSEFSSFGSAISPDGRFVAFIATTSGKERLWLRPLDARNARALEDTDGAQFPFWSPDSRSIGFFAGNKLKRFDLNSVASRVIATIPNGRGGTWGRDNVIVYSPNLSSRLWKVAATGGEPVRSGVGEFTWLRASTNIFADRSPVVVTVAFGCAPGTCSRWSRRCQCRASAFHRECAMRPSRDSRGTCGGSGHESLVIRTGARFASPNLPAPEHSKCPSMPGNDCVGLHDHQRRAPLGPHSSKPDPQQAVGVVQRQAFLC